MKRIIAAAVAVGLIAVCAMARTTLIAQIPFAFHVGDATLPAGTYQVTSASAQVMRISDSSSTVNLLFIPIPVQKSDRSAQHAKFVFNRYGSDYFLSEVWEDDAYTGHRLQRSGPEIVLAKTITPVRVEALTASQR